MRIRSFCTLAIVVLLLATPMAALADRPGCEDPNPLRFALIPRTDLDKQLDVHRSLLRHLESRLGRRIAVVQPTSYGTVIEGLVAGSIDLASVGPGSYALARNRDPSITAFVTWTMQGGHFVKDGDHTYRSLLIVRRDSGIRQLRDLAGKSVVLTDPASTSGGILPRIEFAGNAGAPLDRLFGRITYSGSHDASADAVKRGDVDAAFVASEHLDDYIRQGRIAAGDLRVLWQSKPIPHDPYVFRGRLCPDLRERIKAAFLADSPELRSFLRGLNGLRFVPVSDDEFAALRRAIDQADAPVK